MSLGGSASKSKSSTNETSSTTSNSTSNSTGTQTRNPWAEVTPFITGQNGVLQKASDLYAKSGTASPELMGAFADLTKAGQANAQAAAGLAGGLPRAQQVKAQYINGAPTVTAATVNPTAAFGSLGAIDPTSAFKDLLSGDVTNTYIDQGLKANTDATKAAFADLTADAADQLGRVDLPATRAGANLAGQYGGSRQGIAEGVAKGLAEKQLGRSAASLAASLGQTNAGTMAAAYEAAQGRTAGAASGLGGLATTVAMGNADRQQGASEINAANALDTSRFNVSNDADLNKFNAGLTLDNNNQAINAAKAGSDLTGASFEQIIQGLTGGAGFNQAQLGSFADLLAQYGGLGGTINTAESATQAANENSTGTRKTKGSSFGLTAGFDSSSGLLGKKS